MPVELLQGEGDPDLQLTGAAGLARTGDLVWLSGLTACRRGAGGGVHCPGDLPAQAREAYRKALDHLQGAGLSPAAVVRALEVVHPEALPQLESLADVRREALGGATPALTTVVAQALPHPGALFQVEVVAHRGGARPLGQEPLAVEAGGVVWFSGVSAPEAGQGVVPQLEAVFRKIGRALEVAGLSPSNLLRTVDYATPDALQGYKETAQVRRDFFGGDFPAATGVIMPASPRQGAVVQVEAVAVRGGPRQGVNPGWHRYSRLTFAPGSMGGGLLFVSGMTSYDPVEGTIRGVGDLKAQAQAVFQAVRAVVETAGAGMARVLHTTDYLTAEGMAGYPTVVEVKREVFGGRIPPCTTLVVERLLRPEYLIEVDAVAVLG